MEEPMSITTGTQRHDRRDQRRRRSGHTTMTTYDFTDPISMIEFVDAEPGVHFHFRFADHLG